MKKLLIISPYFPPVNAADMQRVRISLPYFEENGWAVTVVTVDERHVDTMKDEYLLATVPDNVRIIKVGALDKRLTSKLGLGSIALRSLFHYRRTVDTLLASERFDLIYFSTTQFPVCVLGKHWQRKFRVPYVIDMQDPWYTARGGESSVRPKSFKYRLMYQLHQRLEGIAMSRVNGLIAVSAAYINALKARYERLRIVPDSVVTFGTFEPDLRTSAEIKQIHASFFSQDGVRVVYAGRGGQDMHKSIIPVFEAFRKGLDSAPEIFSKLHFYFIGTSYAQAGSGIASIQPLALAYHLQNHVTEVTDRIGYFDTLAILRSADAVFIPGSADPRYTASKIFPYLLLRKPLLAIFNTNSSVIEILRNCTKKANVFTFDNHSTVNVDDVLTVLRSWASRQFEAVELNDKFEQYSARNLTAKQTELFEKAILYFETTHSNA